MKYIKYLVLQNAETKKYVGNYLYENHFVSDIKEAMWFDNEYEIENFLTPEKDDNNFHFVESLNENKIILEVKTCFEIK